MWPTLKHGARAIIATVFLKTLESQFLKILGANFLESNFSQGFFMAGVGLWIKPKGEGPGEVIMVSKTQGGVSTFLTYGSE